MSHALPQDSATSGYCRRIVPLPYHTSNGFLTAQTINNPYSTIGSFSYTFNEPTGDLVSRSDAMLSLTESFTYDILDRLTSASQSGTPITPASQTFVYADNGNMIKKTDVSSHDWNYNKYAVTGIPLPIPGGIPTLTQTATYTAFDKVLELEEGTKRIEFLYRADEQRGRARYYNGASLTKTRYYAENYERTVTGASTQQISYVMAEGKPVAMFVRTGGTTVLKYLITDYLGSITHVLGATGMLEEERSYDAWGRMRSNLWGPPPPYDFDRGYTAQENLFDFNVVNLNGRLYDPLIGRMFSVDPYITDPANAQTYNSYSYCHNNPLKYTDKDGNFATGILKSAVWGLAAGTSGMVHGYFSTGGGFGSRMKAALGEGMTRGTNSLKISAGLFKGSFWEVVSRNTWQGLQTELGFNFSQVQNARGYVKDVEYFHGATMVVGGVRKENGVALGSYIAIPTVWDDEEAGIKIGDGGYSTMHEYGHYLQSQRSGPLYLFKYGLPSAIGSAHWTELDANKRAANYFQEKDKSFKWEEKMEYNIYRTLPDKVHNPKWYEVFGDPLFVTFLNWAKPW